MRIGADTTRISTHVLHKKIMKHYSASLASLSAQNVRIVHCLQPPEENAFNFMGKIKEFSLKLNTAS